MYFFRNGQPSAAVAGSFATFRRVAILAGIMVTALALHSGIAHASVCDTTTSNCTGPLTPPAFAPPTEQATIDQTMFPSAKWNGQLYAIGQVPDPTLCPSWNTDAGNGICDHFQLTT